MYKRKNFEGKKKKKEIKNQTFLVERKTNEERKLGERKKENILSRENRK